MLDGEALVDELPEDALLALEVGFLLIDLGREFVALGLVVDALLRINLRISAEWRSRRWS